MTDTEPCPIVASRLKETLERIGERVAAYKAEEREKFIALAWCRANGNPHLKGLTQ